MIRQTLLALFFAVPLVFFGDPMNDQQTAGNGDADRNPPALPLEPGSEAIILSASHLFVIEVAGMRGAAWARGADGMEHRSLHLDLRLVEKLKGAFQADAAAFSVDLPQKRENALTVSDYHGFWSHTEVEQGKRYLVASKGTARDLPALLQEPAIQALFDAALESDVKLVMTAEQRFGATIRGSANGRRVTAAQGLLKFAQENRTTERQLFSQYLWDRVSPAFHEAEEMVEPAVVALINAPDASIPLREALIYGVYDAVLSPEPSPAQVRFLRTLLELLLQPQASVMFDRMLQAPIYNLALPPERSPAVASDVIANAADRAKMAAVAARYPSGHAKAVAAWLAGQ